MTKPFRTGLSYLSLAVGLGLLALPVIANDFRRPGETRTAVEFWWPVAAGAICLQGSIGLAVAPRINGLRAWMGEAGRTTGALALMAGSFTLFFLFSDEKESFGERILFAAIIPAAAWVCLIGWFCLNVHAWQNSSAAQMTAEGARSTDS